MASAVPKEEHQLRLTSALYFRPKSLRFLKNDTELACVRGDLHVWTLANPSKPDLITDFKNPVGAVFSADEKRMVVHYGWQGGHWIVDLSDRTSTVRQRVDTPGYHDASSYSSDLRFAILSSNRDGPHPTVKLWDFGFDGSQLRWEAPTGYASRVTSAIRPDGQQFVTVGAVKNNLSKYVPEVNVWKETGGDPTKIESFRVPWERDDLVGGDHGWNPIYTHDGKVLVIFATTGRVLFWDIAGKKATREWMLPESCRLADVAPDGRHIAFQSTLGAVSILRLED